MEYPATRVTVAASVQHQGLVVTANAVGVTSQTLRKYLNGGAVRAATLATIQRWANPDAVDPLSTLHAEGNAPAPSASPPLHAVKTTTHFHRDE